MSGPKTSPYVLQLRRLNKLRAQTKQSADKLAGELARLKVFDAAQAEQIERSIVPFSRMAEADLTSYLTQLDSARAIVKESLARKSEADFISRMGKMVDSSESSEQSVDDMLGQIAAASAGERQEAADILALLGSPRTVEEERFAIKLQSVLSGISLMDSTIRAEAEQLLKNRDQELAGEIAVEALEELGYEVEGTFNTLFVEGGMVHFQKKEWGNYFVRMRVNPADGFMNFNMIRAGEPDDTLARKDRDIDMEKTWCSGYPKLLQELGEMGIQCGQMRALDPGAVAVQVVPPGSVGDSAANADARTGRSVLKEMERSPL